MTNQPTGVDLIAAERARQKLARSDGGEGYTAEHDEDHADELALAAASYALPPLYRTPNAYLIDQIDTATPATWPWGTQYWKPGARLAELTKAGALIAAAIDSLQAEENTSATKG